MEIAENSEENVSAEVTLENLEVSVLGLSCGNNVAVSQLGDTGEEIERNPTGLRLRDILVFTCDTGG